VRISVTAVAMTDLPTLVLWAIAGTAALWDLAKRRVPNLLVGPGMLAGLAFAAHAGGLAGVGWSLLGAVVPFLLLVPIWRTEKRLIGAGDIKLYMCVGAFLGWEGVLLVVLYAHLFKGVVALFQLGLFNLEKRRLQRSGSDAVLVVPTTPAALPILAGTLLQTTMPHLFF
jgi:Flp pilus assembly protein protease CpaA